MLWDRGSYELLDAEVPAAAQIARGDFKFRLSGEKLHGDFALVHMKPRPGRGKGNELLLIKKRDDFARPGWNVEEHAWSVLSGRSQEEIAQNLPARKSTRRAGKVHVIDPKAVDPEAVWTNKSKEPGASAAAKKSGSKKDGAKVSVMKALAAGTQAKAVPKKKSAHLDPSKLKGARKARMPEWFEPM